MLFRSPMMVTKDSNVPVLVSCSVVPLPEFIAHSRKAETKNLEVESSFSCDAIGLHRNTIVSFFVYQ